MFAVRAIVPHCSPIVPTANEGHGRFVTKVSRMPILLLPRTAALRTLLYWRGGCRGGHKRGDEVTEEAVASVLAAWQACHASLLAFERALLSGPSPRARIDEAVLARWAGLRHAERVARRGFEALLGRGEAA